MNDNEIAVRIIGDAAQLKPAVEAAKSNIAGLGEATAATSAKMKESFAGVSIGVREMGIQVRETFEAIGAMREIVAGIGEAMIAAFAIEKVAEWTRQFAESSEKVEHLASRFGMTTGQVQALNAVAISTGVPLDAITKGMQILDRNAVNAANGTSAVSLAFKAVGVSANDGSTQMARMLTIADKFASMDDGPKKAALAMELFGRSGTQLIPILNLGSAGIQQLTDKAKEYDVAQTAVAESSQEKGAALAGSVNEASLAWTGLKTVAGDALAPVLKEIVDGFTGIIGAMIRSYNEGGVVSVVFTAIGDAVSIAASVIEALAGVFSALWDVVSDVLSSIFGLVADVFVTLFPQAAGHAGSAMAYIKDGLIVLKDAFVITIETIRIAVSSLIELLRTFAIIAIDALTLNWGKIEGDWQAGMNRIAASAIDAANKIKVDMAEAGAAIAAASQGKVLDSGKGHMPMPKGGGDDFDPDLTKAPKGKKPHEAKAEDDLVQKLQEELQAKKVAWAMEQDAQGTFQQYSLQSEADYWATALSAPTSAKDKLAIEQKFLAARAAPKREEIAAQVDGYKQEIEAAGKNFDLKIAAAEREQAYLARMFGAQAKEARAAADEVAKLEREKAKQVEQIETELAKTKMALAAAGVDADEAAAQFRVAMGSQTNAELIAQERQFEDRRYAIRRAGLEQELALENQDPVKRAQIAGQIEQLERSHQQRVTDITRRAILERTALERQGIQSISQTFGQSLSQLLTLQQGFAATMKSMWQGIQQAIGAALAGMIEQWIAKKLSALIIGNTAETVAAAGAIAGNAAVAASAAYASTAAIPIVGPGLAPAAAATAYAGTIGWMGALAGKSAEGGDWNVTPGLYQLHAQEMVLPAWAAAPLRNMIAGGQGIPAPANDSAGQGEGSVHLHVHALDGQSVEQLFMRNKHALASAVKSAVRHGAR